MTLVEMIVQEYRAAVAKHSFFADAAFDDTELELAEQKLKTSRSKIFEEKWNGKIVGRTILGCELDEAAVDYARGDYAECLVELAQCAVVIIRMMEMVEKKELP